MNLFIYLFNQNHSTIVFTGNSSSTNFLNVPSNGFNKLYALSKHYYLVYPLDFNFVFNKAILSLVIALSFSS